MPTTRLDRVLVVVTAALCVALGGAGWLLVDSLSGGVDEPGSSGVTLDGPVPSREAPSAASAAPGSAATIVVDVEGAVVRPGLHHLLPGARVGDAIAAAGGYSAEVDLEAAARELNLARLLEDGEKVLVPTLESGGGTPPDGSADSGGAGAGELVNVNTATAEELEALPGIGPATANKIIAAREEEPFRSLDELVERGAMNRGQLEQIRDLVTVG